jgi:hypothetical protein
VPVNAGQDFNLSPHKNVPRMSLTMSAANSQLPCLKHSASAMVRIVGLIPPSIDISVLEVSVWVSCLFSNQRLVAVTHTIAFDLTP